MTSKEPRPTRKVTERPGIYRVTHMPTGRTLLGYGRDAPARLNRIRFQLDAQLFPGVALQRDWTRDGAGAFTFEVLDELRPQAGQDLDQELETLLHLWQERLGLHDELNYATSPAQGAPQAGDGGPGRG